jgi:dnd system-associated protein 4
MGIMAERVRRPEQYKDMMDELVKENGVFRTLKDLMVFSATLGFKRDKRVEFTKSAEAIPLQYFNGQFDRAVINSIGVAASGHEPSIMGDTRSDERVRIFEEFACGGLEILKSEFWDGKISDWEDALLGLIMQEESDEQIISDITGLASA